MPLAYINSFLTGRSTYQIGYSDGSLIFVNIDGCKLYLSDNPSVATLYDAQNNQYVLDITLIKNPSVSTISQLISLTPTTPNIPGGEAGGDLTGTYPNPSVNWINGISSYNSLFYPLTGNPSNFITELALVPYLKIVDAAATYYPLTNPSGYISAITNAMVLAALGYTPYDASNPSGYITSAALASYLTSATAAATYVALTRNITINGTTYNLSTDRTWNVGDLLSSGSYADPSWLTSLAYSKLTGTPTIPTVTPSALTKVDDTNITLTLGGTPSTALLQAVSLTLGWTGTLADARIASAATWNAKIAGKILRSTTDATPLTGSTANTLVYSRLVAANTYTVGDIITCIFRTRKTGTAGTVTLRVYINTSAAIGGSLIATNTTGATTLMAQMSREIAIKTATNTEVFPAATSGPTDMLNATVAASALNIDWTTDKYFVFALQNSNNGDTSTASMYDIRLLE